jgi:hypothetical protein
MKRRFSHHAPLLLLFLSLFWAASPAEALIDAGLSGGINFASLDDIKISDARTSYDNRTGYHIGVYAKGGLGPFAVRAGVVYLNAGPLFEGLSDEIDLPSSFEDNFDVRFLAIPVDFHYRLATPMLNPYFLVGPELRFDVTSSDDFEDNLKSTSFAGNIGVGVEFTLPIFDLSIAPEIRYSFDLTGITEEDLTIGDSTYDALESHKADSIMLRVHIGL